MSGLLSSIERMARRHPDAVAIESGDSALTYACLWADIDSVARKLQAFGARSVGLYLDNGIEWIVIDLAAVAATVRVVPLPWFFSEHQIRHAISDGEVDCVVYAGKAPASFSLTGTAEELYREARLQPISPRMEAAAGATHDVGEKIGKMSFTSGSTGNPRGVILEPAFIERSCEAIAAAIPHRDISRHLSLLPYSTLLENLAGVYVPLMLGKTVVAEPSTRVGLGADLGIDPGCLQGLFSQVRPQSLILTPRLLELFCLLSERGAIDPGCLKFVAVGGARVGESLISRARSAGIPAYEGYGLTEFGSVAILNTPGHERAGSVGKPLPGVEVTLAQDGEICLATVYGGDSGTGQKKLEVCTGDYGAMDEDGYVYVHGRKSSLIVLPNGRNVSPEWIEAELDSSPLIAQSCVFATGEGVLSVLLLPAHEECAEETIDVEIARINRALPGYAQVMAWYRLQQPFSTANQMLTANGRLRRHRIARRLPDLLMQARQYSPHVTTNSNRHEIQGERPHDR